MTSAHARTWKKIGLFYALVLAISSVFWVLDVRAPFNVTLAKITRDICDQPYGCRDFDVEDCNGYRLCFGHDTGDG